MGIKQTRQFRFWTNSEETELQDWLSKFDNVSQGMKDILNKFRKGELREETIADSKLKAEKLRVDIRHKNLQCDYLEKQLLYFKTFESFPSSKGKKVMKINIENQIADTPSCFDETNHRIMCPECGSCFVFAEDQHDLADSKEYFIDHYIKQHSLTFPEQLSKELQSF